MTEETRNAGVPPKPEPEPAAGMGDAAPPDAALPADPEAYDSPRASQARARGLSAPYIAGGLDPDPESGQREERRYLRLLVVMIVVVILAGFVLGIIANVLGFPELLGNP